MGLRSFVAALSAEKVSTLFRESIGNLKGRIWDEDFTISIYIFFSGNNRQKRCSFLKNIF